MEKRLSIKFMRYHLLSGLRLLFVLVLLWSCESEPKELVTFITSPTKSISSEPNLHKADDGTIYLSWIGTNNDHSSSLLFSTLDNNNWSVPKTIAKGSGWFVNWADFPSITSFGESSLAAHYLEKVHKTLMLIM